MATMVVEIGAIAIFGGVNTPAMKRMRYRHRLVQGAIGTSKWWDDDSMVLKVKSFKDGTEAAARTEQWPF